MQGRLTPLAMVACVLGCGGTKATEVALRSAQRPSLRYASPENVYVVNQPIAANTPLEVGGPLSRYESSPSLPRGLSLDANSGLISGTPTELSPERAYVIVAQSTLGSVSTTLSLSVVDAPPTAVTYSANPAIYRVNVSIAPNVPTPGGEPGTQFSISPALPEGLVLDPATGIISGTPTQAVATRTYTVTVTTSGGSAATSLVLRTDDVPSGLSYASTTSIYIRNNVITPNVAMLATGGGATYTVVPALPPGLQLDPDTGTISGTPSALSSNTSYTITATNTLGSTSVSVSISVIAECQGACVASAPPGWSGPVAVAEVLASTTAPPSCVGDFPTEALRAYAGPMYAPAACGVCEKCTLTCQAYFDFYNDSSCTTGTGIRGHMPEGCGSMAPHSRPYFHYHEYAFATCAPGAGTKSVGPLIWGEQARLCTAASKPGACAANQFCVGSNPFGGSTCIYKITATPATETCPAPYVNRAEYVQTFSDSRDCSQACTCSADGASCSTNYFYEANADCSTPASPPSGQCLPTSQVPYVRTQVTSMSGACTNSGSNVPIGTVTTANPVVVCCL